jgi:phage-related protein (TIGR01555 family)
MNAVTRIIDGFANIMTGRGTTADKRVHGVYYLRPLSQDDIQAAYRSSWLMRKVVDRPVSDMTRAWRDWQAEKEQITLIEAEEKRLGLRDKIRRALTLGRLGGGALILGVPGSDTMLPLNLRSIRKGGLRYVHVVSRYQLSLGEIVTDPENEFFGQPAYYELSAAGATRVRIHPSRVIAFKGLPVPDMGLSNRDDWFWGDSLIQAIEDAVKNADAAQGNMAALIEEAKVDVIKVKGLMSQASSAEYEAAFLKRFELANVAKSVHRALLLDSEEEWSQHQITWNGMPEVLQVFLSIVAGAADIPATILLGKSPDGMNATGDSDFRSYYDHINSKQENELRPLLERVDEVLLPSALGTEPKDIAFTWAPLWQMDEKQAAEVFKIKSEAVKIVADTGLVPDIALSKAVGNFLIEDGLLPGIDVALEEAPDMTEADFEEPEPVVPPAANENTPAEMQKRGAITADQAMALITDARPRTLYVQRKLLNAAELIAWAKAQGFETTLDAADMHVTITYSRSLVDWMKVGSTWNEDSKGQLEIKPGGPRVVEPLGDKGAIVLLFASSELCWRHEEIKRAGASHDFEDYQPHVTITYDGTGVDLAKVEPYRGRLLFGPEIFEELDEDWSKGVTEK